MKTVRIFNFYGSETDPKSNFAEWAEKWASDERCLAEEGREDQISASLFTVLLTGYVWDPDRNDEYRRLRVPTILKKLKERGIDVQIGHIL